MPDTCEPLNVRLGFKSDDRVLVLNADDGGYALAVNEGIERTLAAGVCGTTTLMAPTPWVADMARRVIAGGYRAGVHLTGTSEFEALRYGPVLGDAAPSLCDGDGARYFPRTLDAFHEKATVEDARKEWRAQIERVLALGVKPTHLDSHMGVYHFRPDLFDVALALAREYRLTLRDGWPPRLAELRGRGFGVVDLLVWEVPHGPEERRRFYRDTVAMLPAGVTEIALHPAADGPDWRALAGADAAHRLVDVELFATPETRAWLADAGVKVATYADLQAITYEHGTPA
jgi:hypothetical protein